ncbi:MAG: FMN-binding protein [Sedimentisphaerales bacterium]
MKDSFYTFSYAAALGTICALLLTGVDHFTGPYKQANARAEKILNILGVLEVPVPEQLSPQEAVKIFEASVIEEKLGAVNVYKYLSWGPQTRYNAFGELPSKANSSIKAVAIPFEGAGLWGPIKGFLALKPDMETILGITIYEQEETPGLGGEIASPWFRDRFKGKSIIDASGKPGVRIKQAGGGLERNEVDAITGATMTCNKLQTMLNAVIEKVAKELQ